MFANNHHKDPIGKDTESQMKVSMVGPLNGKIFIFVVLYVCVVLDRMNSISNNLLVVEPKGQTNKVKKSVSVTRRMPLTRGGQLWPTAGFL